MRFKVHNVDAVARAKGFRRSHTYEVRGISLSANPDRGALLILRNRRGVVEGFYLDQGRWVDRGDPLPHWLADAPFSVRQARKLVRGYRKAHPPMARIARAMQTAPWAFGTSTGCMTLPGAPENIPRSGSTG